MPSHQGIDAGRTFDWGRTSSDYGKYRDIYPPAFYQKILDAGLCRKGQRVLDLGTGTGVLPRNLYSYGASFVGVDLAAEQIETAKRLSAAAGMEIEYQACAAEDLDYPDHSFDVVTACQCFFYFDHARLLPKLHRLLKSGGKLAILYMAWLPHEDPIAGASEDLILKYNPQWSGCGEVRRPIDLPDDPDGLFRLESACTFDLSIPFTRESWNGRMKACRGIGASLTTEEVAAFEAEHLALLRKIAPERFEIQHYASMAVLSVNHEI